MPDPDDASTPLLPDLPTVWIVVLAVFAILFVAVVVLIVLSAVRSARRLRAAGIDPLAADAELAVRLAQSRVLAADQGIESRLAELDDLARRGVITADEHEAARQRALDRP